MNASGAMVCLLWLARMVAGQEMSLPISVDAAREPVPAAALIDLTLRFEASIPDGLEVVRLERTAQDRAWRLADVTRHVVGAGRITTRGRAGADTLLLIRSAAHPGYILDGPFRWPAQPGMSLVRVQWRRSLRSDAAGTAGAIPVWLGVTSEHSGDGWPVCFVRGGWECVGVPLEEPGVVVLKGTQTNVAYGLAPGTVVRSGVETVTTNHANWGRLLLVTRPPTQGQVTDREDPARVLIQRVRPSRVRPQSNRFEIEIDPRAKVDRIGRRGYWISGSDAADGWLEVAGRGLAPTRLEVRDVAAAPAEVPLRLTLEPSVSISGRVLADAGRAAAAGAVTTLYRLIGDAPGSDAERRRQKRVPIAEVKTDAAGMFRFDDLAAEPYEVLAMHPVFGRGERRVEPNGQETDISLRRSSVAIGRVLRDHVPASGVLVTVVPDLGQFASSEDMTELRAGETRTDRDGRFSVALAARGRGELRIGEERTGIRRVPLGPAETLPPIVNAGTIELHAHASVTLVLEQSDGCDLILTGPAGRTGMTLTRGVRIGPAMFQATLPEPGTWHVVAVCAQRERAVAPAAITVAPDARDSTIRLTWPVGR